MRQGEFLAGPIHWYGEKTKEEEDWFHDVLNEHRCARCHQLAKKELAQALLEKIGVAVEQSQMATLTKADIVGFLEDLKA